MTCFLPIFLPKVEIPFLPNVTNFLISDGSNVTDRWRMYNGTDQTMYMAPCMSWYWTQTHTAGASVTFSAQARDGNTNGTVTWGDNGSNSYIVVQEIAQ